MRLGGVDHRAAAHRHQQVGLGRARGLGAGHHVLARAVRADGGVGADVARAQRLLHALQRPVLLLRQRARGGDEHALGADALGLGHHRLAGRRAEHDALLRLDMERAGNEPGARIAHGFAPIGSQGSANPRI